MTMVRDAIGRGLVTMGTALRWAMTVVALSTAVPAWSQMLILRSIGPSRDRYVAGRFIADNASMRLQAGDEVVLLRAGVTRRFRGPGVFAVDGPARLAYYPRPDRRRDVAALYQLRPVNTNLPGLWMIDTRWPGRFCIRAGTRPVFWRAGQRSIELSSRGSPFRPVFWPRTGRSGLWPADLPIVNDAAYAVRITNRDGEVRLAEIAVRIVDASETDIDAAAQALFANECRNQTGLLPELFTERQPETR